MVQKIQQAVNAYYAQFEEPAAEEAAPAEAAQDAAPAEPATAEAPASAEPVETAGPAAAEETAEIASAELPNQAEQSGRIEDAGSPTHKPSEGTVLEGTGSEEGAPEGSGE
jgi:phage protein D